MVTISTQPLHFHELLNHIIFEQFVIVNSVQIDKLTDPKKTTTVEHIVGSALSVAGTSITMTTATDSLAFYTGYFCDLPGVSAFSVYAGTCVLCDFVFQITFFIAVLSLDCSRIRVGKPNLSKLSLNNCVAFGVYRTRAWILCPVASLTAVTFLRK